MSRASGITSGRPLYLAGRGSQRPDRQIGKVGDLSVALTPNVSPRTPQVRHEDPSAVFYLLPRRGTTTTSSDKPKVNQRFQAQAKKWERESLDTRGRQVDEGNPLAVRGRGVTVAVTRRPPPSSKSQRQPTSTPLRDSQGFLRRLKVGTGQEVLRLPKPPDPIPQQPPTLPSDHQADEESDADHRTKASSDGNDSDIDDDDFNSIFRGNDSPTAEVAPGEDGDGTFGDDSSVDGGQAGETGEIDGGNIDRQEDEKSDMGHGIEASSGGNSPDVDDDNDSILSEDLGIDGDQAGEIEEEEVPASIPKLPLSPGDIESVMTEVDNILNEPSVSNISAEKKKSIRANCQWLADHNAQPEFIKNVALYRASIAAGNMGVEEDIKSTADMAVESTADMTDLSQRYHNYSEEDAAEKLCSDQYSELKRRINSQPIAVPNLSNISPALTIPAPEELQLVQEHWVRGNMALVTAVRDTVNQSVLQSPVKNSNSPISETVSLAKDTGVFNTYGIDTSTREKNNELYGELTSKVAKDLTFFYAQQQEIFDNNNFLGKIPGSPPTVMAVRKVTPEALLEMISVNGNTSTFEAKKAHGAESWSLIIPVDDDFATDVKVGGSAMITADIPVYEIGMSCVGMKIIQEKDQMELVRYPFSDLSVNVYNKVGKGIHHMGQKRGVTTNAEYRGYQDSVLDKLKENNQI